MNRTDAANGDQAAARRFAAWMYGSLAAFVVLLTLCYFLAGPVLDALEKVVRRLFL